MKTRKILSFVLAFAMLMSTVVCHAASEPTEYYQLATYKTTSGNYLEVDLDKIFTTGETYKIGFNVKPDELTGVPVSVSLADSNTAALQFGLLYLYENGAHALGGSNYSYGGGMSGFKDSILANGIDMEMSWNTATGKVDIDIWYAHNSAYPAAEHKTFTYAAGVIGEGQKYGKLKIGGENSAVTVTGLDIMRDGIYAKATLKKCGIKLKGLDYLKAGNAQIGISYSNTESTTPTLYVIVAYYNGEQFVYADVVEKTPSDGDKIENYTLKYTVPSLTESYDEVKVMVWDGIGTMVPFSQATILE